MKAPDSEKWSRIDRGIRAIDERLKSAVNEEDFQGVGLLCREVLISLAQAVFDPSQHLNPGEPVPSSTDAKRMLDAYLRSELRGRSNEAARRQAKAAVDLANDTTHRRTATLRDASMCADATKAVVRLMELTSSRRKAPKPLPKSTGPQYLGIPPGYERRLNQIRFQIIQDKAARTETGQYAYPVQLAGRAEDLRAFAEAIGLDGVEHAISEGADGIGEFTVTYSGSHPPSELRALATRQGLSIHRCGPTVAVEL